MSTWTVYEYARLYRDSQTKLVDGNLLLSIKKFDALKKLIVSGDDDHHQLFRYGFEKRKEVLICQNYVGVICLPDGDQIEILPKTQRVTSDHLDQDSIILARKNLIKMLKSTRYLPGKIASTASLDVTKMPLLDIFIQLFLNDVSSLVKQGIARHYQQKEENLPYMKGKLLVSQQIRTNIVMKHRHYMEFDELSSNRAENKLIKSALFWALKRVQGETEHLCQELLFHFSEITESKGIKQDLKSWQRGRHIRHYEAVFPWIEMIFNQHSPTSVDGSSNMLSLLFPMERVFEDYVAQKLKVQFDDFKVKNQVREYSLITHKPSNESKTKRLFQLRPDLHITTHNKIIIADTKWKLIDENLPSQKYKISESDIYQMLAYNQTYQKDETEPAEIWLIYPMSEKFTKRIPDFKFDNGCVIKIIPFDVNRSSLLIEDKN